MVWLYCLFFRNKLNWNFKKGEFSKQVGIYGFWFHLLDVTHHPIFSHDILPTSFCINFKFINTAFTALVIWPFDSECFLFPLFPNLWFRAAGLLPSRFLIPLCHCSCFFYSEPPSLPNLPGSPPTFQDSTHPLLLGSTSCPSSNVSPVKIYCHYFQPGPLPNKDITNELPALKKITN